MPFQRGVFFRNRIKIVSKSFRNRTGLEFSLSQTRHRARGDQKVGSKNIEIFHVKSSENVAGIAN